ncbi:hypothetical protein Z043_126093, partial [Scleropages formosus]
GGARAALSRTHPAAAQREEARGQAAENNNTVWELDDGLDEAFSRLAESRTNPQVLDIGLTAQDLAVDECLSPDWDKPDGGAGDRDDLFGF